LNLVAHQPNPVRAYVNRLQCSVQIVSDVARRQTEAANNRNRSLLERSAVRYVPIRRPLVLMLEIIGACIDDEQFAETGAGVDVRVPGEDRGSLLGNARGVVYASPYALDNGYRLRESG
jgi:hypothetical protein